MHARRGVGIIELLIVAVLFIVFALVAIPRFSAAAEPSDDAFRLRTQLKVLRVAMERYRQDHGVYPAADGSAHALVAQLTRFTDADGSVAPAPSTRFCFGPYLRDGIPPCPVAPRKGESTLHVVSGATGSPSAGQTSAAWIYDPATGRIRVNSDVHDADGRAYRDY